MASTRTELATLKSLLTEADLILSTTELPEGRAVRCRELLRSALALTGDLIGSAKMPAAAVSGAQGRLSDGQTGQRLLPSACRQTEDACRR